MPELTILNRQRGRVKAKLTNFSNFVARVEEMPGYKEELPLRVEKAENLLSEFDVIQSKIEDIDDTDVQVAERKEFEDTYYHLITKARKLQLSEGAPPDQVQHPNSLAATQLNNGLEQFALKPAVRLPTIELPKFDGNYEHWIPFRDLFESLIASNALIPPVQKLHYLRSALVSDAAKVIAPIEITNDNYKIAWDLLRQRFENKKLITHQLIQTLLDLPSITKESHADLRQLVDNVSQITQNLAKLGQRVEHFAIWVIHIILPKIDKGSRREWEFKRSEVEEFPTLNEFITFLISRSACLEAVSRANRNAQPASDNNKTTHGHGKNTSKSYIASNNSSCPVCANSHKIYECDSFLSMSIAERNAEIKRKNLCIKCLKQFHGKGCRASNCRLCKGYHNSLLHRSKSSMEPSDKETKSSSSSDNSTVSVGQQLIAGSKSNAASVSLSNHATKGSSQVLLSTAALLIYDSQGRPHKCRAILDSGSQSNFITRRLSDKLELSPEFINKTITGISDVPICAIQQADATIKSCTSAFQTRLTFLIIDRITDQLPTFRINRNSVNIPGNLKLADPHYHTPGDIDLLLGASIFWELLGSKQIRSSCKVPILQETALGWIISGNVQDEGTHQQRLKTYCSISTNATIQRQLEKFWHLEEVNQTNSHSKEEIECEEHFVSTHSRNEEGRFITQLPFKDSTQKLGESYGIAERRLRSLERKLEKDLELKQRYHEFMQEYLRLGHMTEIPLNKLNCKPSYYIPHHAVTKEDSETTKLRVVFDASCKTTSGRSINDLLRIGPNLQDDLFDIVMRLRQYKYAMTADITKMYRQVQITEEHRKFQRILWRWSREEPIRIFELNTVTYGMSSSSFIAIRCLQELAHQFKKQYPLASEVISRDFYVDDLLT
ncbi:uncharacterized protein, partial [Mycetomoellerius zeteki]|uniref:uncharacterized protein n=1 Tax=Mycetomoellerius zeteki TaxID=64791 RepID=UPI00084E760B